MEITPRRSAPRSGSRRRRSTCCSTRRSAGRSRSSSTCRSCATPTSRRSRKRKNPVSINYYRDAGILPQALLNFLGLMGWSFGGDREKFTLARDDRGVLVGHGVARRPGVRSREADLAQREVHPRAVVRAARRRADRLAAQQATTWSRCCRSCASASRSSTSSSRRPSTSSPAISTTRRCSPRWWSPTSRRPTSAKALLALVERFEAREGFDRRDARGRGRAPGPTALGWKTKHAFMLLRLAVTGAQGVAAAVRDDGGARQGDHAAPAAARRRGHPGAEGVSVASSCALGASAAASAGSPSISGARSTARPRPAAAARTSTGGRSSSWSPCCVLADAAGVRRRARAVLLRHLTPLGTRRAMRRSATGELKGFAWWSGWRVRRLRGPADARDRCACPASACATTTSRCAASSSTCGSTSLLFALILPAVIVASTHERVPATPIRSTSWRTARRSTLWSWEVLYALQFLSLEFFFRGFLLQGLRRALGANAIFVMIVPYCMIHYGKPMAETLGAIVAGRHPRHAGDAHALDLGRRAHPRRRRDDDGRARARPLPAGEREPALPRD